MDGFDDDPTDKQLDGMIENALNTLNHVYELELCTLRYDSQNRVSAWVGLQCIGVWDTGLAAFEWLEHAGWLDAGMLNWRPFK